MKNIKIVLLSVLFVNVISGAAYATREAHYDHLRKYNRWYLADLYSAIKPSVSNAYAMLCNVPNALLHSVIGHSPHEQHDAVVRFAPQDEIGADEKVYLQQRMAKTHEALEQFLGIPVSPEKQPRIGLCFSGGGFRAMLLTLGFLIGAQDCGLLDCTTYISGLSGSTWILAPWLATQRDLHEIRDTMARKIGAGVRHLLHPRDYKKMMKNMFTKVWFRQFISAMDIYGALLANTLLTDLGGKKLTANISDSHEHILLGNYPMPIYTCISTNQEPYEWFEFTPFEMGSSYVQAYVPTWAYGRKFKNGQSYNRAPEQTMGYCMGIFGSAFEVDIDDVIRLCAESIQEFKDDLPENMQGVLDTVIQQLANSPLDDIRLAPSMLPNFVYNASGTALSEFKTLSLVDAGIDFNLPFPPLLRAAREVDIIIVYDSSAGTMGKEVSCAAEYAKRKGIPFPPVPEVLGTEHCTIMHDPDDEHCPTIIYMPRLKNDDYSATFDPEVCIEDDYCGTFNFKYSQKNINELSGLAEYSCHQYAGTIKQVIAQIASRKS